MGVLKDDYAIMVANNGERALQFANATPKPDLILLDVMMPGVDGYEVCRQLKSEPKTRDIPVIFVTSLSGNSHEARGLKLGAVDFVTKPFQPSLVLIRIRNQLELKRHRDHLEELVLERTRRIKLVQEVTINALSTVAETRDPETGGHIMRTQNYVKVLAIHAKDHSKFSGQLDDTVIDLLYQSAPLHDVGKVGIPDSVLLKGGKLTEEEFEAMKRHTYYGRDILEKAEARLGEVSFLNYASEIAYTHHERWNGTGYPRGLSGDRIPLSGRLMAIADVYDALVSKRVYKPPIPHSKVVSIIEEGRGSYFDPDLADIFMQINDEFRKVAFEFADFDEERDVLAQEMPAT